MRSLRGSLDGGSLGEPVSISLPDALSAFLLDLRLQGRQQTARTYGYLLLHLEGPAYSLTERYCRDLMTERSLTLKLSSLRTFRAALRSFCAFLVVNHYLPSNPTDHLPKPRQRAPQHRYLSANQLKAMYHACTSDAERLIIVLCGASGLRAGELVGLRRKDVGETTIRVMGKGSKPRELSPGALAMALCRPSDARRRPEAFVLPWRSTEHVRTRVRAIARRVGIMDTSTHQLRHSFALAYLDNGGSALSLQQLLGHADGAQTQYYLRSHLQRISREEQQRIDLGGKLFG